MATTRMTADERRASILAAASQVFAESGYARARMSDVAAALGVSEPVIFQNFGSKAALYTAVLEAAADRMSDELRAAVDEHGSAAAVLRQLFAPGHLDRMHARDAPGVLFADAVALTAEPDAADAARRGVRSIARALTELVTQGQQAGEIRADLDAVAVTWWVLSMFASHGFRTAVMPNRATTETHLAQLMLDVLLEN